MLAEAICRIGKTGLMEVVRVETIGRGIETVQGCTDGDVDVLEISYTNNNAGEVVRALKEKSSDQLLVGAGMVLDPATARLAVMDGAEFAVAPTFSEEVQEITNLCQIPYASGCTSYTEMIEVLRAGASFIGVFPIFSYYGPDLTKVFKMPCPQILVPADGGVDFDNLYTWFENGVDSVGPGGLLTKGSSADTAENARGLRTIAEESRKAD